MPRKRQTQSGAPAQPVGPTPGQMYGAGEEQMALQKAMPAPMNRIQPNDQPPIGRMAMAGASIGEDLSDGTAGDIALGALQQNPQDKFAQLIARAQELKGQGGLLTAPTGRPNEPVTAGLTRGLGPGPEALSAQTGNPVGQTLRKLSQLRGDPYFAELADRAGI